MRSIYVDRESIADQVKDFMGINSLIQTELEGLFGSETLQDMYDTMQMYQIYEIGSPFTPEGGGEGDYIPADHRFKIIKTLIDKEARFLFSTPPKITLERTDETTDENYLEGNNALLSGVLESNHFYSKLVRAAKDCLIGKRIAFVLDFNDNGIDISMIPSLEFIYETDTVNTDRIIKFVRFYSTTDSSKKSDQRVYKKKWELNDRGVCVISEEIYDGNGKLVETIYEPFESKFNYIPCWVVINEGLIGDPFGKSDVESLIEDESWYSKLGSKDIDSLRRGTDQIVYTMDVNPRSTRNLSRNPGSFWDLNSDPASNEKTGQIGALENNMTYSGALDITLSRLRASMFSQLDIPDTTSEALTGVISSGKTMKAMYWGLMVRCDEKLLDWIPALRNMVHCIIEGSMLYPNAKIVYTDLELSDEYLVNIEGNYPLIEDEAEEKGIDMAEVQASLMSRRTYMKKWHTLSDSEVDKELERIAEEKALLEDSYMADQNGLFNEDEE